MSEGQGSSHIGAARDAVSDIENTLDEMEETQLFAMAQNEAVFGRMKTAQVNKLVYENLLDLVDEISTELKEKVNLKLIRRVLLQNLRDAKENLRRRIARYKYISGGVNPQITDHRQIRARRAGKTKSNFDTDDESDTGESDDSKSDHSESEEEDREPTGNTPRVSPDVKNVLREALQDAGENQQNAREFIAKIEEMNKVIHDLQQQLAEANTERKDLTREAAETGRESAQFVEKMRESQQDMDALTSELARERETRATFEGRARILQEEAQKMIREMEEIQREHSKGLTDIQESMAEEVERQVRETLTTLRRELDEEGNDSGSDDSSDHEGERGGDGGDGRNDREEGGGGDGDDHEQIQAESQSLYQQSEDLSMTAAEAAEAKARVLHKISEITSDIEEKEGRIEDLCQQAAQAPGDVRISDAIAVKRGEKGELMEDLDTAKQDLAVNQDEIAGIRLQVKEVSKKIADLSAETDPEDTADARNLEDAQKMANKALEITASTESSQPRYNSRPQRGPNTTPSKVPSAQAFTRRTTWTRGTTKR